MKKIIALILALAVVVSLCVGVAACNKKVDYSSIKVGFIFLHGTESSYDKNFIDAANATIEKLGLTTDQYIIKTGVPENEACTAAAEELVAQGCNIIFADSFSHEPYLLPVAEENPDVQFCHATGTMAHTEGLANFHNAFASIYEGRFLAGIAAGLKLYAINQTKAEGQKNYKMGYVGAYTFAEVMSGYTSFFLGAKYALNQKQAGLGDSLTMDVSFTGSWFDPDAEKTAAETLIGRGCALVSGHADSDGVPSACEEAGIPNVFYNGTHNKSVYLCSCRINWAPYFEYIITQTAKGEKIDTDYTGTLATGSVEVLALGSIAAEGTQAMIDDAKAKLIAGTLQVFDVSTFKIGGQTISEFMADVDTDANYTPDHNVVKTANGITYVAESDLRSGPYFNGEIDGINLLNRAY